MIPSNSLAAVLYCTLTVAYQSARRLFLFLLLKSSHPEMRIIFIVNAVILLSALATAKPLAAGERQMRRQERVSSAVEPTTTSDSSKAVENSSTIDNTAPTDSSSSPPLPTPTPGAQPAKTATGQLCPPSPADCFSGMSAEILSGRILYLNIGVCGSDGNCAPASPLAVGYGACSASQDCQGCGSARSVMAVQWI